MDFHGSGIARGGWDGGWRPESRAKIPFHTQRDTKLDFV